MPQVLTSVVFGFSAFAIVAAASFGCVATPEDTIEVSTEAPDVSNVEFLSPAVTVRTQEQRYVLTDLRVRGMVGGTSRLEGESRFLDTSLDLGQTTFAENTALMVGPLTDRVALSAFWTLPDDPEWSAGGSCTEDPVPAGPSLVCGQLAVAAAITYETDGVLFELVGPSPNTVAYGTVVMPVVEGVVEVTVALKLDTGGWLDQLELLTDDAELFSVVAGLERETWFEWKFTATELPMGAQ